MRLPFAFCLALLLLPTAAHAGTIGREGTELVYRSAPGENDYIVVQAVDGTSVAAVGGERFTPGPGCDRRSCSLEGVTGVRVFAADGNDQVEAFVDLPVSVDLGPGEDVFAGHATALSVSGGNGPDIVGGEAGGGVLHGGAGDDRLRVDLGDEPAGSQVVLGGEGDDDIRVEGIPLPGVSVAGGAGDDAIDLEFVGVGPGVDVNCGPGADRVRLYLRDRPGEGCAARVAGITARTVSRTFREGRLLEPAAVAVTFYRLGGGTVARGTITSAAAGPLRLRLKTTPSGRRAIRRDRDLELGVRIKTRTSGDTNDYWFGSRLAS